MGTGRVEVEGSTFDDILGTIGDLKKWKWSNKVEDNALWRKPLTNLELRIFAKIMTLAPIFSSQNYFR